MRTIKFTELNEVVRSFLVDALKGDGVCIEDSTGSLRGSVVPYRQPTSDQKKRALESLQRLQEKTSQAMQEQGVTEDDVMRVLLEDD